ncbi:hypothetical protein [Facklamia hominis]|uniref:Uncharacterized protein n=1 Tax=Facklamia hominis CCUG 36813 TaxID=883111 RepID=K1MEP5_9LACT|nr:hypothetical protein [Facklamia hominis]EKB54549.1 hypothetical protein HMPREF9706_00739 [Facklamia hominis CCUG 36813]EPH11967.1 hypothetical protein HMPREF9260_00728 [Facklamia hominis ACS-120-V-Sch10]RYC97684.1 hypothetical protein EKN08_06700 [Facklamia hominis]
MTMENSSKQKYFDFGARIALGCFLILFTQGIKLLKNPASTPITGWTLLGLLILWLFSMLGIFVADFMKAKEIPVAKDFPILGWVSIVSLIFCLIFGEVIIKSIQSVDFLAVTTPILAVAGISVADSLVDLRRTSWKIMIVAAFVFIGTYLGSALISQLGLWLTGAL